MRVKGSPECPVSLCREEAVMTRRNILVHVDTIAVAATPHRGCCNAQGTVRMSGDGYVRSEFASAGLYAPRVSH